MFEWIPNIIIKNGKYQKLERKKVEYIIGVDFGASGSGVSICENKINTEIKVESINSLDSTKYSDKTLTQILYDGPNVKSWGSQARISYFDVPKQSYTLLKDFKLSLYKDDYLSLNQKFKLVTGEELTGEEVTTKFLENLLSQILKDLKRNYSSNIVKDNIRWCFTVPAIWRHDQMDKMKKCCVDAGFIYSLQECVERFCFCFEPEAAALCIFRNNDRGYKIPESKSIILVFDLGGRTIDITCHEIQEDYTLKEVIAAQGRILGSQELDSRFYKWFIKTLGLENDPFFENNLVLKESLIQEWIVCKERYSKGSESLKLDKKIVKYFKKTSISNKRLNEEEYFFELEESDFDEILGDHFSKILDFLKDYLHLTKDYKPKQLILTGGLSKSDRLFEMIDEAFKQELKTKVDSDFIVKGFSNPINAVSIGACYFGLNPRNVLPRRSKLSYFLKGFQVFENSKHNIKDKEGEHSKGFIVLSLENDESLTFEKKYPLVKENQKSILIEVYSSKPGKKFKIEDRKKFLSYDDMIKDLNLEVNFEIELEKMLECNVKIQFGEVDIIVTATTDKESKTQTLKVKNV